MTPGCSPPNTVHGNFLSILPYIERAAGAAGATLTVHDGSKPAHVRLSRGVLVAPARKAYTGHLGSRRFQHGAEIATGGPAALSMVRAVKAINKRECV